MKNSEPADELETGKHSVKMTTNHLEFTWAEIEETRKNNKILTFGIELSNKCNFRCIYCYRDASQPLPDELTQDELFDAVKQAVELGARKAGVVGAGEPTLDSRLIPVIRFIRKYLTKVSLFTNGTGITLSLAQELARLEVKVVLKINSLNPDVHDELVGKRGGYELMMQGLQNLIRSGYPQEPRKLEIESVVTKVNINDLPSLWCWCRDKGFVPFFERLTPLGRAINSKIDVSPLELLDLFKAIKEIDEENYGYTWEIQPPFVAQRCLRHYYNCLIDAVGNVLPCSGVNIVVGNIRKQPLSNILSSSPVIRDLRYIDQNIKGECANCELKPHCYGCRGAAFHLTGDYLAPDPMCWRRFTDLELKNGRDNTV